MNQPFSSRTPVIDLLIDPEARAILDRRLGGKLATMPRQFISDTPPTFAAILTARELLTLSGAGDVDASVAALDQDLAQVRLTPATIKARCARYDTIAPKLPTSIGHPAFLVFDKINGFRDSPSVKAAEASLREMAATLGWTLVFSDNGAVFNRRDLARFNAVIWNNVSGDAPTLEQRAAFRRYIERGGGFVGIHGSGGDPAYFWNWYPDTLIGARFLGHPAAPQFQVARVRVEGQDKGITRGLGDSWTMTEEWYSFRASPRRPGVRILASLDESTYSPKGYGGQNLRMGDHPIAWNRCIANGRSFYTAIGHRPESYSEPHARQLLEQGITWAGGLRESRCKAGVEQAAHYASR